MGFNLENQEDGALNFEADRREILDCTILYLKGRFDPLLSDPLLTSMRNSFEHSQWPPREDPRLKDWGVTEVNFIAAHYKGRLASMERFDLREALHEWSRLKKELHSAAFFGLSYKKFWEHVSRHFDTPHGYPNVILLTRITSLLLPDSSICEVGFSAYNRVHTAQMANLKTSTVCSVLSIKALGPKTISDFNPSNIYEMWMGIITPDANCLIKCPRRRNIAAMIRKMMQAAQVVHDKTGALPAPGP